MQPERFAQKNFTFTKPEGMTEEQCGDLEVWRGNVPLPGGQIYPAIISCWRLSPEELAEVNKTGVVWLEIISNGMPPVSLNGFNPIPQKTG